MVTGSSHLSGGSTEVLAARDEGQWRRTVMLVEASRTMCFVSLIFLLKASSGKESSQNPHELFADMVNVFHGAGRFKRHKGSRGWRLVDSVECHPDPPFRAETLLTSCQE